MGGVTVKQLKFQKKYLDEMQPPILQSLGSDIMWIRLGNPQLAGLRSILSWDLKQVLSRYQDLIKIMGRKPRWI